MHLSKKKEQREMVIIQSGKENPHLKNRPAHEEFAVKECLSPVFQGKNDISSKKTHFPKHHGMLVLT